MDDENSHSSSSSSTSSNSFSDNDSNQQPSNSGPVPDNPASPARDDDDEEEEGEIAAHQLDDDTSRNRESDDESDDDEDNVLPPGMTAAAAAPSSLSSVAMPPGSGEAMFHPLANLRAMDNRLLTLKETAATRPPTPPELKKEEPCDISDGGDSDEENAPVEIPQADSPVLNSARDVEGHNDMPINSLLAEATPVSPAGLDDSFGDGLGSSPGSKRRSDEGMLLKDELDFEEGDERESGEEGELGEVSGTGDALVPDKEEGEISEEEEDSSLMQNEPKTVCRFFNKGQCTWGTNCRFLHPGVSDKGNYNMFAPAGAARGAENTVASTAIAVVTTPDARESGAKVDSPVAAAVAKGTEVVVVAPAAAAAAKKDEPAAKKDDKSGRPRFIPEPSPFESAWERGLRHAKDLIKRSHKRREMDADFEEKRFNLSLGQAELDRENDYYTRPASPVLKVIPQDPTGFDPYNERQAIRHFRGGYFENFEVRYHVDPSMVRRGGGVAGGGLAPPPGPGGLPTGLPAGGGPPRGREKFIPAVVVERGEPDEIRIKKKHPDERRYPRSPGSPKSEDERLRRPGSPGGPPLAVGGEDWADPWARGGDMAAMKRGRGPAPPPPGSPSETGSRRGRGVVDIKKKARKLRSRSYSSGTSRSSRSSSGAAVRRSSHSSRSQSRSSRSYSRSHSRSGSPPASRSHRSRHRHRSGSPMPPGGPPPGHYPHGSGPPPPHHRHPGHRHQPGGPPPPHHPQHFDPNANGGGFYPPHEAHYPPQPYFRGGGGFNPNYRGGRGGGGMGGGPPPHYAGGPPMDQGGRYPPNQQYFRGRGRGNFRGNFRGRFPYNHYNNNNYNSNYNNHQGGGPPYPPQHHGGPGGGYPPNMNQHGNGGRRGGGPDDGRHAPRDPRVDAFGRMIRRSRSAKRRGGDSRSRSRSVSSSSSRSASPPRSGGKRGGRPPGRGGRRRKYSLSASRSRSGSRSYSRSRSRSISRSHSSDSEQERARSRQKKSVKARLTHPKAATIIPTDPRISNLPPTSIGFEARKKLKGLGGKKKHGKGGRKGGRRHSRSLSGSRSRSGSRSVSGSRSRSYSSSSSSSSSGSSVRVGRRVPNPEDRPRAPINTLAAYTAPSAGLSSRHGGPKQPPPSQAQLIDPSKVSGQKQQIKLTLKPSLKQQRLLEEEDSGESDTGGNALSKRRAMSPADETVQLPRKMARGGEPLAPAVTSPAAPPGGAKKSSTASRREELLMQLRAVEDAIAKKRNKLA